MEKAGYKKMDPFRKTADTEAGMGLIHELVKTRKIKTPIMVLSVVRNSQIQKELYELGIKQILTKPVLIREVEGAIADILGKDWREGT